MDNSEALYKDWESLYEGKTGFQHNYDIQNKNFTGTYGEIVPNSVREYMKFLCFTKNDVFYDLGSGIGKIPVQLYCETELKKSYGVELVESRHKIAEEIATKLNKDCGRLLHFCCADFTSHCFHFDSATTVVYLCSTCFTNDMMNIVLDKMENLPLLRAVITLKKFEGEKARLLFEEPAEISTPSTWSQGTKSYIYCRKSKQIGGRRSSKLSINYRIKW